MHLQQYICAQDDLISEAGVLFCNTLSREPSKKDVKVFYSLELALS